MLNSLVIAERLSVAESIELSKLTLDDMGVLLSGKGLPLQGPGNMELTLKDELAKQAQTSIDYMELKGKLQIPHLNKDGTEIEPTHLPNTLIYH